METLPPDKLEALFLSTPSEWRATESIKPTRVRRQDFYPRPPGGGRLYRAAIVPPMFRISIHALRVEGDWTSRTAALTARYFYPRPPGGGRPGAMRRYFDATSISIHALRVEGDGIALGYRDPSISISIHALRVEGDKITKVLTTWYCTFLSTPSGWRATDLRLSLFCSIPHFYPRPPGGGRQQKRTKFSSVFAQKGEEFASLRRGKRKICWWRFKKDKFWVLIWCEGSGKSVCALASHCG